MPRSASTWSFNVCKRLLQYGYSNSRFYTGFSDQFTPLMEDLGSHYDHIVLKSHQPDRLARSLVIKGGAKAVYTHRDPYDAVASYMRMFERPFEEAIKAIGDSLEMYRELRPSGHCLGIAYQDIMQRSPEMIRTIQVHLGLAIPIQTLLQIQAETDLDAMRDIAGQVGQGGALASSGTLTFDKVTLLHRNHIRDGGSGYGRGVLSQEQRDQVDGLAAPGA